MRYIFKNIKNTILKAPLLAFLMVLCLAVSTFVILYSHGAFQNYQAEKTIEDKKLPDDGAGGYNVFIEFDAIDKSGRSTIGELKQVISLLSDDAKAGFTGFFTYFYADTEQLSFWDDLVYELQNDETYTMQYGVGVQSANMVFRLEYHKESGEYGLYSEYLKNQVIDNGRNITEEEEITGANVALLPFYAKSFIGQEVDIYGSTYTVVGTETEDMLPSIIVPFKSMNDEAEFKNLFIMVDEGILTTPVYNELRNAFEAVYGDRIEFPELETADVTEIHFYNTLMWVSVIIAVISAINLAILFRYILNTRRKSLSIMRICGCTKNKARRMYVSEIMLISIAIYWICAGLFHKLMLHQLVKVYEHITDVYSTKSYLIMFGIYIAAIYIAINAMTIAHVRSTPVGTLKERGR